MRKRRRTPPRRRNLATGKTITPKEHGAWGVGGACLITGALAARHWNGAVTLLLVAALGALFARTAVLGLARARVRPEVRSARRRQAVVAALAAALAGAALLALGHDWLPAWAAPALALGGLDLWLAGRRQQRSLPAELAGLGALTWLAPAAYGLGRGEMPADAALLWGVTWLYFGLAVPYVKMFLAWRTGQSPLVWERAAGVSHALAALLAAAAAAIGWLSPLITLPFVLAAAKALYGMLREWRAPPTFFQLGWRETALALVFAGCAGAGWGLV